VLVGSLPAALTGAVWWLRPHSYPFGTKDRFADLSLRMGAARVMLVGVLVLVVAAAGVIGPPGHPLLALAAGFTVAVLGALAAGRPWTRRLVAAATVAVSLVWLGAVWLRHRPSRTAGTRSCGGGRPA
jgi:membrane protein implicated in regulation of membrane protease activity